MEGGAYRERAACKRGSGAQGATGAEGGANWEKAAWRAARGRETGAEGGAYRERAAQRAAKRAVVHELLLHKY